MKRIIPHELQQIKARQIYEKRIARGIDGNPKDDWEQARKELIKYSWGVRAWKIKHGIWKILTFPFWLFDKLPQLFANTDTRPFALDVVKTVISAFSLTATIFAGVGLYLSYQNTKERLITDRFGKAVEQLGKKKDTTVRIGGIYALERIAKDYANDFWTIMEVLTSYVRENSSLPPELKQNPRNVEEREQRLKELENLPEVSIDVQAALTVIGRREDPEPDRDERIDLSNTNLKKADLRYANLQGADLRYANLQGAYLGSANLQGAMLLHTDLQGAILGSANLQGAMLLHTDLQGAYLGSANLQGAMLWSENLTHEQIKSACFWEKAIYTYAEWNETEEKWIVVDEKANQKRIEEIKQDKASEPDQPPNCNRWK